MHCAGTWRVPYVRDGNSLRYPTYQERVQQCGQLEYSYSTRKSTVLVQYCMSLSVAREDYSTLVRP